MDLTFKAAWQQTLRKTAPILGTAFLIVLLTSAVPLIAGFLLMERAGGDAQQVSA